MKLAAFLFVLACLLGILHAFPQGTSNLDSVDVDAVLSNNRILQNYIKCLLDKGPCTQEGRDLKKLLPDAVANDCEKCSAQQKKNSTKVINFLRANKPAEFRSLLDKYDPDGAFQSRHPN